MCQGTCFGLWSVDHYEPCVTFDSGVRFYWPMRCLMHFLWSHKEYIYFPFLLASCKGAALCSRLSQLSLLLPPCHMLLVVLPTVCITSLSVFGWGEPLCFPHQTGCWYICGCVNVCSSGGNLLQLAVTIRALGSRLVLLFLGGVVPDLKPHI